MRTLVELRIAESRARRHLAADEGKRLGATVRKVVYPLDAPRLRELGDLDRRLRATGDHLFGGWEIKRVYSRAEFAEAELLRLLINRVVEPAGEELGTEYDESVACTSCGAGRMQRSRLRVDTRKLKNIDAARTIAQDEWLVSGRLAGLLENSIDQSLQLLDVDTASTDLRSWCQLQLADRARAVRVSPRTRFGIDPFDSDDEGRYRCPGGHVAGLNVLSEVWVYRESLPVNGIAASDVFVGHRTGLLRPHALLFVTPTLWAQLQALGVRGCSVEVARIDDN